MESERKKIGKALLFVVIFTTLAFVSVGGASTATIYVNPSESIQAAVDAANPYETIIVRDGTYTENVDVYKSLTIQSENGSENCIVQAANPNDHVFEVTADHVNISGFTVKDADYYPNSGIYIGADYCNISNNNCSNNRNGIGLCYSNNNSISNNICLYNDLGIFLNASINNSLSDNICHSNNCDGILLHYSDNNSISNNNCSLNNYDGVHLWHSNNTNLSNNYCHSNNHYFGIYLYLSNNNSVFNNTCSSNSNDGIFVGASNNNSISNNNCHLNRDSGIFVGGSNNSIFRNKCSNNSEHGIYLYFHSTNNNIFNNYCSNNHEGGIHIYCSSNNSISGNDCLNNSKGIYLFYWLENNIILNNTCSSNNYGIYLGFYSNKNAIYLNNFINNIDNVYSYESTNIWNSTEAMTYTYKGRIYTNYTGNYWSDYIFEGNDTNGDGIGDSPYSIDSDADNYPLMLSWEDYFKPPEEKIFDTGQPSNPYPSIMGTHKGEIEPSHNINVSKLYTYPCVGTGGHTESIKLYENGELIASGTWTGYKDDYHNISITPSVTLSAGHTYNYTIVTGSYPQIIHEKSKDVKGGTITCTSFIDANGKTYTDWIPAIRLE